MPFICKGCHYVQSPPVNLKYENNGSDYLLVFQAPGFNEWTGGALTISGNRIPIDSKSTHSCAARMRNSFIRKNVLRYNYDIAEAVCCYPGVLTSGRDKKPKVKSVNQCTINMANLLSKKKYTKITCFGDVAYKVVMNAITMIPGWAGPTPSYAPHPSSGVSNLVLDASY